MWPFKKNKSGNLKEKGGKSEPSSSKNYFIDSRDSKKYKIKRISNQVWMVENLSFDIGLNLCCYFQDDEKKYKKYGMLYNWEGAMKSCPEGWRIPSKDDFKVLFENIGGSQTNVMKNLKKYGFENLFDGWKGYDRHYHQPLGGAKFWTSSNLYDMADFVNIRSDLIPNVSFIGEIKGDYFTVCCIKN